MDNWGYGKTNQFIRRKAYERGKRTIKILFHRDKSENSANAGAFLLIEL